MFEAGAVHDMGDRAVADLAIGRVLAMQQRIDHRVLEMGAPPPGHEGIGIAAPALRLQERGSDGRQPALHVDHRAVLVEHADLYALLDEIVAHGNPAFLTAPAIRAGGTVFGPPRPRDLRPSARYRRQRSSWRRRRSTAPASRRSWPSGPPTDGQRKWAS